MLKNKKILSGILGISCLVAFHAGPVKAQEVGKGKIPAAQLEQSYKKLDWGVSIWDTAEATKALKSKDSILWVDTRPESFFKKGTVAGAVNLIYNKAGMEENTLTPETLDKAMQSANMSKDSGKIAFFCQGPKCHRSYNASFQAVTQWGYNPSNIVWFREGYPYLFKEVKANAKLKRKATRYISEAGIKQL